MAHAKAPPGQHAEHFEAIGRLIDTWAHLEFQIDHAIWALVGADQATIACVTSQLIGVNNRLRALRSLLILRGATKTQPKKLANLPRALAPYNKSEIARRTILGWCILTQVS
jgi:hypothetical protein